MVRDFQICSVVIEHEDDRSSFSQRYIMDATLEDVYNENPQIDANQLLQYDDDFVLSRDTRLSMLIYDHQTPIRLTVNDNQLPATVTISCEEQERPIKFQCLPSITIARVKEIVAKLWSLTQDYFCLASKQQYEMDSDLSLSETFGSINDIQLIAVVLAQTKCTVTFYHRQVVIPITQDMLVSLVLEEAIERFYIPREDRSLWKLCVMDDVELPTEMDLHQPAVNAYRCLSEKKKPIPFQLVRRKQKL